MYGWTADQIADMTPYQATVYRQAGKSQKSIPIFSDDQGIEITKRHRLKMLAEARAMVGKG